MQMQLGRKFRDMVKRNQNSEDLDIFGKLNDT